MPSGSASAVVSAAAEALRLFDDASTSVAAMNQDAPVPMKDQLLPAAEVKAFEHEGHFERGLVATGAISPGDRLIRIPRSLMLGLPEDIQAERFKGIPKYAALSFQFAEKKASLVDHAAADQTPVEKYWAAHIKSLPSYDEYREAGMPLAAPESDLKRLKNLPIVSEIEAGIRRRLDEVQKWLPTYNAQRGSRPEMQLNDAVWGRILVASRSFACNGNIVAPVVDFMNNAGEHGNIDYSCSKGGDLEFTASDHIARGDELSINYKGSAPGTHLIEAYGEYTGAKISRWPQQACTVLREAHLEKGGPMLRVVNRLAEDSCQGDPDPFKGVHAPASAASNNAAHAIEKTLPSVAQAAANPLAAVLSPAVSSANYPGVCQRRGFARKQRVSERGCAFL